jgi:alpha-D-ribose 1-methylphosphonate 5-triphosphate synthase subunit PhnI
MYVAVKGGEKAIAAAHRLLALAVDRVMTEGSVYDRELAALAIKQARGDLIEAIFLLRAYRTTLPRLATSVPIATERARLKRRISATFKDLPGGQMLGPTFDYTHRLIDFALAAEGETPVALLPASDAAIDEAMPRVSSLLGGEGLIEPNPEAETEPGDLTREPLRFPADRAVRLQNLARGDEGYLLALGYSTQRGYGRNHPFAGEIRIGEVEVEIVPPELGFPIVIGEIAFSECEMVNQFKGSATAPPQFTRGYGLAFGEAERKAMAMALVDRALRAEELGEEVTAPAQDQEFVLYHSDNVEASGFTQHLKLPHYVDFQAELNLVRRMRAEWDQPQAEAAE